MEEKIKKKSWTLLWVGFVTAVIIYLFIFSGFMGVLIGFGVKAYQATTYHLKEDTALVIVIMFLVLKDIVKWIDRRRK